MATDIWNGASGPGAIWSNALDWSTGIPQATDDVSIPSGSPILEATTPSTTVASVTIANVASLAMKDPSRTLTVTGNFADNGGFGIDSTAFDIGGSTLAIGGMLTVTNSGAGFAVGNYFQGANPGGGGTPSTTTVTANSVTNTGAITIQSDDAIGSQAILNVASVAGFGGQTGVLTGNVNIGSDGLHAGSQGLLEFASGQITTIASASQLFLYGPHSYVADAGSTTSNSALTGLTTISGGLVLQGGALVTASGGVHVFTNAGVQVDTAFLGTANSTFAVGGLLTVDGSLSIGREAMTGDALVTADSLAGTGTISVNGDVGAVSTGKLIVNSAAGMGGAVGHLTASVTVKNQSLLQFASGQVTTIDYPANVIVDGPHAFIADAGSITSNSALAGLTNVNGFLTLLDGALISTSAGITVGDANTFHFVGLNVDNSGTGGSDLTVGGTLTFNNGGGMTIGNDSIAALTTLTASALDFATNNTGQISLDIHGNTTAGSPNQTLVALSSPAGFGTAGVLANGSVSLKGNWLLQFASGQIDTLAFGGSLTFNSANSFVADAGNTSSNSALTGLTNLAGQLILHNGASIATAGDLTVGDGMHGTTAQIDSGSELAVNGTLTNDANCTITIGLGTDTASATVTATGLDNAGTFNINGASGGIHGILHVTGAAAGAGTINLANGATLELGSSASGTIHFDTGSSTLKFDSATA